MRQFDGESSHGPGEIMVAHNVLLNFALDPETETDAKLSFVNKIKPLLYRAVMEQITGGVFYVNGTKHTSHVPTRYFGPDMAAILLFPPTRYDLFALSTYNNLH